MIAYLPAAVKKLSFSAMGKPIKKMRRPEKRFIYFCSFTRVSPNFITIQSSEVSGSPA
jgi:hypothetical protein